MSVVTPIVAVNKSIRRQTPENGCKRSSLFMNVFDH